MKKQEQILVIKKLMNHLDDGTTVDAGAQVRNPVSSYTDESMAVAEWQTFFHSYPQVLGLSGDLPGPASYFTSRDLGKPILCTRDGAGKFRAFLNTCRHRGAIVESEERGTKEKFSCPFHAWCYNNLGELVVVPREDHFGSVDKSCHGLVSLPAVEKYGLLWIHPDPQETIDVDDLLGDLAPELESWNLQKFNYQDSTTFQTAMNWKLAIDTFGETYHFNVLHRSTLAEIFYGNVQTYDVYKRNHRMVLCLKTIDNYRQIPEENWQIQEAALPVYFIFPNIQLTVGGGGPTLVRVYPDGQNPNHSHSQISSYLDPDIEDLTIDPEQLARYQSPDRLRAFAGVIENEDYAVAAGSHFGALSGAQEYITFGRNEPALHHYHNTYREALGLPPIEKIPI